jgi:signal transduction histidine kinase
MRKWVGAPGGDVLLAGVLAVFAFVDVVFSEQFSWLDQWRGVTPVNAVVVPAAALLLAWRRRYPSAVLAGTFLALDALGFLFGSTQASTSVFTIAIAVYTAVAYAATLRVALGIMVVGVWLRDAYDPLIRSFGERIWDWVFVAMFVGIGYATRARRARLATVEQGARDAELAHAARVEAAAEEERRRIARELHDIVAHSLGLLIFQAGVGEQFVETDPGKARDAFQSIRVAGLEAIGEMSTILGLIRGERGSGREPQPRAADIAGLVGKARDTGVTVDFDVHGDPPPLPAAVELSMYRIAQEGLTNAIRYAPSASVRIDVRYHPQCVDVEVVNGQGGSAVGRGGGRGLIGLAERVAIFGGRLDVGPQPGGGWRLAATLPVAR